ncbi:hypothetical protein EV189_0271 [Motilibacter rhizosphaerae]|uniref:DUF1772 domain-containing protein n=1 Tax=Motilibacter rhizosphaerae TaxID=598652 RepID=A0A4V2F4Z5_9ACTN|nr:hypothetical protein [Motilibacter rhizosphaerae]RZS91039.1 hypothetical protein EV189_0271 [Motilibacter rhizosphaerae]
MSLSSSEALLAASALHAGFQLVVTGVVYPALAEVPPERFAAAHERHSRRITAVVAPVYLLLAAACLWVIVGGPYSPGAWVSVVAAAGAAGTTALLAAPAHSRLGRDGRSDGLVRRLLAVDRVRCAFAVLGALAALLL